MKAVVYKGPNEVNVEEVPDAKIERPTDVLVRITATNICGSDLHMYEGAPISRLGARSATKTWARLSRQVTASTR
jgi:threonine dehydrogenase-like Zn-dependent dehydrogenase